MANQKISQLTAVTSLASGDYFPVVQASGTTNKRVGIDVLDNRYYSTASGAAVLNTANQALSSGNAALSRAGGTMTGQVIFANGQQINTAVNLSGGVSGAVPYQSAPNTTTFLSPGTSGQVLATQGSNQVPQWITPAGGKVLQVVSGVYNSSTTTTSVSYVATTLKATITPSSTTSRVLVQGNFVLTGNLGAGVLAQAALHRGGTQIIEVYSTYTGSQAGFSYIDQPATSGSTTYEMYFKANPGGGNPATFNGGLGGSPVASIVVSEIGA